MSQRLLLKLRSELKRVADPQRAVAMQRYMKSSMPYYGVSASSLRQVCRQVFVGLEFDDAESWQRSVLHLFRNARFREEWYAAVELCEWKKAKAFQTLDTLSMYEEMIVTAAWWDVVDALASHQVGALLRAYPKPVRKQMLEWSCSDNVWKRRTSIICQLGFKGDTDLRLLYACIEPSLDSNEFFLRKAIGWALRQYAWTNPRKIEEYVRAHGQKLSPLSKREALKNIYTGPAR